MAKRIERDLSARRLEMEHEEAMAEHLGEVARIEADKEDQIHNGLMAILVGLACLVFVGVFLARLAIERHLRELRKSMVD